MRIIEGFLILTTIIMSHNTFANEKMSVADFFNKANFENLETLCTEFYDPQITFIDPIGEINGLENIIKYYKHLYENVLSIKFITQNEIIKDNQTVYVWQMHVKHKKIKGGENIIVEGNSILKYKNNKVIYHRDYFDIGSMVYENIPVLGSIIKWIKSDMQFES